MRFLIGLVILTSATISAAETFTGDFATDGVFDAPNDTSVVRNHLELTQTGTQIRGRLLLDHTVAISLTGSVAADGRASLVFSNRTFPIERVKSGIELTTGDKIFLFKRAPPVAPLAAAVLTVGGASTGARFSSPWGASAAAPAGWTTKPHDVGALFEGERIAIYADAPRATGDEARTALGAVLRERGGEWQLMTLPAPASLPGATAEVLEVAGFDADEVEWRARVVSVTTKVGTIAITGVARVGELATLRARVDEVARSAKLVSTASEGSTLVTGEWWTYEAMSRVVGNGGTTFTISLCPDGRYTEINETTGTTHSSLNNPGISLFSKITVTGRWIAVGKTTGTIKILRDDNGKTSEMAYRVLGSKVAFGRGQPYFRKALGRCST